MTPTKLLIGQILIVFAIVIFGVWFATEWCAAQLDFQPRLGAPWFGLIGLPVYYPWRLFQWWYFYDAYAPRLFNEAGGIAASSGLLGCAVAIIGSLWRARQTRLVTTYGSSRWATTREIDTAGLFRPAGVFLGRVGGQYLRHDGPEHVVAFAPTRSGKGVGLVIPTLLSWTGSAVIHDIKGENWQLTAGWREKFSHCLLFNPTDIRSANLNIIDQFLQTFIQYIDGGFGLLNGDVVALTSLLIGIDITLAGLFWALDRDGDVLARLIKKTLYIGAFAFIINNFQNLATIIFNSFSTLGLNAAASGLSAADLLLPGKLAGTGFTAAYPLLQQAGSLIGFSSFFTHFVIIVVLLFAWFVVVLAFFILAVQLFITILEFKLTTLAGFVLVPFALWNRTAFLAERVLGNVVSSGVKIMVLAVIVGIGSTLFNSFTVAAQGQEPTVAGAMSLVLASITLLGLGIFGPAIATGLVSGAPQLGAGAAIGTAGAAMLAGGAAFGGARLLGAAGSGGLAAIRAGTAMGSAASTAYRLGEGSSGATGAQGAAAGIGGIARAGAGAAMQNGRTRLQRVGDALSGSARAGRQAAWRASGGSGPQSSDSGSTVSAGNSNSASPDWARRLQVEQRARYQRQATSQAIREGDRPGAPANPNSTKRTNDAVQANVAALRPDT